MADAPAAPAAPQAAIPLPGTLEDLKTLSHSQLDELFLNANGDVEIPIGKGTGYPILFADAELVNGLANQIWGGKEFHQEADGSVWLKNYIGPNPLTLTLIKAKVFKGHIGDARPSLAPVALDAKPSIVLNYTDPSIHNLPPFSKIVDEIRLVNPQTRLFLGRAHLYDAFVCYFALQFDAQ